MQGRVTTWIWRWQMRSRIRSLAQLERVFALSDDERAAVGRHAGGLPVGISDLATGFNPGSAHTCAIAGGELYCWGYNSHGQLGDGLMLKELPGGEMELCLVGFGSNLDAEDGVPT